MIRASNSTQFENLQLVAFILILLVACSLGWANEGKSEKDWPGWRGHGNDAIVTGTGLFESGETYGFKLRWKVELGSGYSSVSIAHGMAVTMFSDDTDDYVIAFDAMNGEERWRYRIDKTHLGRFGSLNGPISTPLIADGKVVCLGPRGQFFALNANTGKLLWSHHLVETHGVAAPLVYGFTSSPIRYDNILILETSNPDGSAVTGFDLTNGEILWKAGNDSIAFQSPFLVHINDKPQVVVPTTSYIYGLEPTSGQILWEFQHTERPGFGSMNLNPIALGNNNIYLKALQGEFQAIRINEVEGTYSAEEIWKTRRLQRSYVVPVVHEDYIYGLNGRFFSCFDAKTGKVAWKSRQPGDGFPMLIDGHLVTMTKKGSLHLAEASPEGYQDIASIKVFSDLAWTPPSYANGHVYVRSTGEIACVEIVAEATTLVAEENPHGQLPESKFAQFVASLASNPNKKAAIDNFMSRQTQFPIIEGDNIAHFIYRGEAEELAIMNEQIGNRMDHPMHRVADTDFFYYSTQLEPDARIGYRFLRNTSELINDSLNSDVVAYSPRTKLSRLTMPKWKKPAHLKEPMGAVGRVDTVTFVSPVRNDTLTMHVYLPSGYEENATGRYPAVYMLDGRGVQQNGLMNRSLDNLIGTSVEPLIMVYVYPNFGGWYIEYGGENRDKYFGMLTQELIPHIDANYRTIAAQESRGAIGTEDAAFMALYATTKAPGTFSRLGLHSASWGGLEESLITSQMAGADKQELVIYHDWGKYDYISPMEGTNIPEQNRRLREFLKEQGYSFSGGQLNDGGGWPNWRNRTASMLEKLFPLKQKD